MTQHKFEAILALIQDLQKNIKAQQPSMTPTEKQKVEATLVNAILQLNPKNDLTQLTK